MVGPTRLNSAVRALATQTGRMDRLVKFFSLRLSMARCMCCYSLDVAKCPQRRGCTLLASSFQSVLPDEGEADAEPSPDMAVRSIPTPAPPPPALAAVEEDALDVPRCFAVFFAQTFFCSLAPC